MTDVKFLYDEPLVERCAQSSLYRRVVVRALRRGDRDDHDEEGWQWDAAPPGSSGGANGARDEDRRGARSDPLRSRQEHMAIENHHLEDSDDDPQACVTLFHAHQRHYYYPSDNSDGEDEQRDFSPVSVASYLYGPPPPPPATTTTSPPGPRGDGGAAAVRRFEAFVENVGFVHRHNHDNNADDNGATADGPRPRHRVALNRFSDRRPREIFPGRGGGDARKVGADAGRRWLRREEGAASDPYGDDGEDEDGEPFDRRLLARLEGEGVVVRLDDADAVLAVAMEGIGRGSMNHLKPKRYKKIYHQSKTLSLDPDAPVRQFQTPDVVPDFVGAILSIRPQQPMQDDSDDDNDSDDGSGDAPPSGNPVFVSDQPPEEDEDVFARNLNWATTENPDGIAIVHEPIDQGTCGACWAFAATGSLEASASRRAAYNAYRTYVKRRPFAMHSQGLANEYDDFDENSSSGNGTAGNSTTSPVHYQSPAIVYAQNVQSESFQRLNLSIQELIDCDTAGDQGCTGGNPLLSFYFIHRYGLTTWDKYPYVGHQDECREHLIKQPVATVKSWGIVSPNHEAHMELVLRHIGPIAAGVNGASPSFLAYSGGIYDNPYCRQGANHALLITGYGEEVVRGKTVRFWRARNSWGLGWGENGYVRIRRNDGVKGSTGVCGIARSPSVALGGVLLPRRGEVIEDDAMSSLLATHGPMERQCFRFGLGFNSSCLATTTWLDEHKVVLLAMFGVLLFMASIYLLTYDIRRRRRRRNDRRRRLSGSSQNGESSALLTPAAGRTNGSGTGYGTGTR